METYYGLLKSKRLTRENSKIVRPYCVDTDSEMFRQYKYLNPGINVSCTNVYSFCCGVVVKVGTEDSVYQDVSVQYNSTTLVRYKHLKSVAVEEGQPILPDVLIGVADKFVHFEYCTTQKISSVFAVRVDKITYYKQDPTPIVNSDTTLPMSVYALVENGNDTPDIDFKFSSKTQEEEFSTINKGDAIPLNNLLDQHKGGQV